MKARLGLVRKSLTQPNSGIFTKLAVNKLGMPMEARQHSHFPADVSRWYGSVLEQCRGTTQYTEVQAQATAAARFLAQNNYRNYDEKASPEEKKTLINDYLKKEPTAALQEELARLKTKESSVFKGIGKDSLLGIMLSNLCGELPEITQGAKAEQEAPDSKLTEVPQDQEKSKVISPAVTTTPSKNI